MTTQTTLAAGKICRDQNLSFRHAGLRLDRDHIRTLAAVLKRGRELDPITAWREQTDEGVLTGRTVLLDGAHRMAAYASLKTQREIPITIFEGTKKEAWKLAGLQGSKASLPLSVAERTNMAWRMVLEFGYQMSKAEITQSSGVSDKTVAIMRKRRKVFAANNDASSDDAAKQPTGIWWQDRREEMGNFDPMSDEQREVKATAISKELRRVVGMTPRQDWELFALSIGYAFPTHIASLAQWHLGADWLEEQEEAVADWTGAMGDEENTDF
ncbi:hypothetical protein FHS72_002003 [Loktanella ponticola]|uniref:ParB/Sulfiredoxin domain-containing protein n=1 Tax=Yoonia ponticola TaxID=1524255 RepID=A0A7W9EY49_9RHOB|nr:ParB N-terminal domain-containing protein [Yoonia ponticola]MBB5722377.1 hypothetical protein [Yoonia ponticola]